MNNQPLVSIVIPFYKTEKEKLMFCLRSVIEQTYKNIEILIIDDGSGDQYTSLLDSVQSLDARIKVYRKQTNEGLSAARNAGLRIAKSEYVMFVDSDDMINCSTIQSMIETMMENDVDMVIGGLKIINDYQKTKYLTPNQLELEIMNSKSCLERLITNQGFGSTACGRIAQKEIWEKNGDKPFIEGILHEDMASMWTIIERCKQICFLKGPYYYYYQGGESDIHKKTVSSKFCEDFFNALKNRNEILWAKYPALQPAISYSYLSNIPLIYMYTQESDEQKRLEKLKKELWQIYKSNYKKGMGYNSIKIKDKMKFIAFRLNPSIYQIVYKTKRRIKHYRI